MPEPLITPFASPVTDQERATLLEWLPEIAWVQDPETREGVVQVWVRAWRAGNWPDLTTSPFLKHIPAERWNGLVHVRTVTRGCRALAVELAEVNGLAVDFDTLIAAALLHDVGKVVEYISGPDGVVNSELGNVLPHAAIGAQWALEAGLSAAIAHAIYAHTPAVAAMPTTVEASIVHYVDTLVADACLLVLGLPRTPKTVRVPQ